LAERARSGHLRRELGYVRKDGTKFTAEVSSVILPDRATSFVILRDITERKQDITERRQAEEALRAGSTLLNGVLESSLSGIMAFKSIRDAQGRITDFESQLCNATAERMVGRRATDLVGRKLLAEMPGNKADGLFDKYVVVVETGRPLHHEHYYEHEGLKTWFDTCAVQLGDGFAVTFSDITVRKRAEEALERSKQRLAEVLDSIEDDFYALDRDWRFTFTSEHFTSRIGKRPENFLGHNIWEMFPKHLGTVYEENLRAAMDKRETRRFAIGGTPTSGIE
jgi:PAS domain-containing protein